MTTAADIRWGVELETHVPVNATPIGRYHRGIQVPWLPDGWRAEKDMSIRVPTANRAACEFVSPCLSGGEGLQQVAHAADQIRAHGAKVNDSCGVHVTCEFNGCMQALKRLIALVASFEKALYASTGTHRRENGRWCRSVRASMDAQSFWNCARGNRYHLLNVTHFANYRKRVEFRVFSASLNPTKLIAWIRLCVGLVERALTTRRAAKWTSTSTRGPWNQRRGGKGEVQMSRLFYQLGWTKGPTRHEHGLITYDGCPTTKQLKTELFRLAKKYDQSEPTATLTRHNANTLGVS